MHWAYTTDRTSTDFLYPNHPLSLSLCLNKRFFDENREELTLEPNHIKMNDTNENRAQTDGGRKGNNHYSYETNDIQSGSSYLFVIQLCRIMQLLSSSYFLPKWTTFWFVHWKTSGTILGKLCSGRCGWISEFHFVLAIDSRVSGVVDPPLILRALSFWVDFIVGLKQKKQHNCRVKNELYWKREKMLGNFIGKLRQLKLKID